MKSLWKRNASNDQTSPPANGYNTRGKTVTTGGQRLELIDTNRNKVSQQPEMVSVNPPKPQTLVQPVTGIKRSYATFQGPIYANSATVQQSISNNMQAEDSHDSSSNSYQIPAKRSGSVLRNTLASSSGSDNVKQKQRPGRKPTKPVDAMSEEEYRRLEDRRRKNKEAAQRCRSRRMGKIQELEERIKVLNGELSMLTKTHEKYKQVPDQLRFILSSTNHVCCLASSPPSRPIHMPLDQPVKPETSPGKANPSSASGKSLNSPTLTRVGIKRPTFLNRPITNLIAEQKRPSSQPSPSVTLNLMPSFSNFGTPGDLFASTNAWAANATGSLGTPGLLNFQPTVNDFLMDVRTPSRDMGANTMLQALDLQVSATLETPTMETPRLTAL